MPNFETALNDYLACVNFLIAKNKEVNFPNLSYESKIEPVSGRKYLKLAEVEYDKETGKTSKPGGSRVYAFVEVGTGNVYKAASWKAPTLNHVRGNIYDLAEALKWVNPYGVAYVSTSGAPPEFTKNDNFVERVPGLGAIEAAKLRKAYGLTIA